MVQINEIRYKNYFETVKHGSIIQISGFRTYSTDKPLVRYENHGGEYGLDQIKPIKLTEEWLLKAGFEKSFKNDYWYSIRIGDKRLLISILGNIEIEKWDRTMIGFLSICEYVHKLQNLYFALVGEELVFSTEP